MKNPKIIYYGLTRLQLQTLRCKFSARYGFEKLHAEDLDNPTRLEELVCEEGCLFLNPQKLSSAQLKGILDEHRRATEKSNAVALMFSNPVTKEQSDMGLADGVCCVNLIRGNDKNLDIAQKRIKCAMLPCSEDFDSMASTMFNDSWYLVDIETTGFEPLEDEIIMLSVSLMSDFKIRSTKTYYVKPRKDVPGNIAELIGVTKEEMMENGISREELVDILCGLPVPAPIVFYSESYFVPFMKALFLSCGKAFDIPYLALDELASVPFGYLNFRSCYDILEKVSPKKYQKPKDMYDYIEKLYRLTLVCFEALSERYGIRAMGEIKNLYNDYLL